jgi:hypothetical protein
MAVTDCRTCDALFGAVNPEGWVMEMVVVPLAIGSNDANLKTPVPPSNTTGEAIVPTLVSEDAMGTLT